MGWGEILGLSLALGVDAFAVGMSLGLVCRRLRQMFSIAFGFGFFQFLMPVIGWYAGDLLTDMVSRYGPWLSFAILLLLGLKMIREAFAPDDESPADPSRGLSLLMLSLAVSIDALGVGFSLGILKQALWIPAFMFGLVTFIMTLLALQLGYKLSSRFGKRMNILGGVVLISIGLKIVLEM